MDQRYTGHAKPSALVPGAFEARDFFPTFGENGKWLHFMAAPIQNVDGEIIGAVETLVDLSERPPEES